jgi:hypothetical protein
MVYVNFGNPVLREHLAGRFCEKHRALLEDIRRRLPGWAAAARAAEARAAAAGRPPRPLAAVLDIDEVILCNIHMNEFRAPAAGERAAVEFYASDYFSGPDGRPWPRDEKRLNPLLSGARALLEDIRRLGLALFLITGRLESIRNETIENFVFVGLAGDGALLPLGALAAGGGSRLIMCPDADYPPTGASIQPWKEGRRALIDETHHIVINVGDQVSDLGYYGDVQIHCPHPYYLTP